jgi:cytochrome c2
VASLPTPTASPVPADIPTLVLTTAAEGPGETAAKSGTEPPVTVASVSATTQAEPGPATPASETAVDYGLQVYQVQYCGLCHKLDAAQTKGLFGPTHNHIAGIAEGRIHDPKYTGTARTAAEYIRESILDPQAYIVPGYEQTQHHMPAYTHLSQADVEALVQMLIEQK